MKEFIKNKYFKFGFWSIVFIVFVIWIGSYWLLFGLPIIFDFYVSKKVNWTFWKKRNLEKKTKLIEWIDALVFAVIAATIIRMFFIEAFTIPTSSMEKSLLVGDYLFVSKVSYGPKMPNTPISFPFVHHTLPLTKNTPSFLEWIKMPYKRLAGFQDVKNDDVVVFNFPAGDTVVVEEQAQSYYSIIRQKANQLKEVDVESGNKTKSDKHYYNFARDLVRQNYTIIYRPVDKRENYIKRCIGIHGDSLQVKSGIAYINGVKQKDIERMQFKYYIKTKDRGINTAKLQEIGLSNEDINGSKINETECVLPLTLEMLAEVKRIRNVESITKIEAKAGEFDPNIFPYNEHYKWNVDNFGPLYIPEKGKTVKIDSLSLPFYRTIIETYEGNKLEEKSGKIFINGKESTDYTFKMNYYFMMGDSRHNSADSRYWGFVPEDHVVGKALFIWMSSDPDKGLFDGGIRWNRIFNMIH